jgi:branched-chain amino acid transport system permease protein
MNSFILQTFNGITYAALLFLLASGFTLTFGLMRIVNMAHGAYYLLGGYVGLTVAKTTGSFTLALLAGGASAVMLGWFNDRSPWAWPTWWATSRSRSGAVTP